MIRIGTSGYSYQDWIGPFYPQGTPDRDMLAYYARHFNTTEINYTYYRLPSARTLAAMASKVPDGFLFTVKVSQELTHGREDNKEAFQKFVEALQPLREAGKFGCILAQFPWSFRYSEDNFDYLQYMREQFGELPVVVELRNREWIRDETFDILHRLQLGFCAVDEPQLKGLLPPVAVATSPIGYVRFHGRNYQKWWQHEQSAERYDYTYSEEELKEWVPKIQHLEHETPTTFVFANNHARGQAITTAKQLSFLLEGAGSQVDKVEG